ncbi:MAG: glycerol-3-phosphate acyltransferase, partial [Melioribacteraceae bacterium]
MANFNTSYFVCAFIGIILGSIPTAYIILKKFRSLDITKEGSGNVGTLNSFEVTNSKLIGISVFIIDFGKGLLSVFIVNNLYSADFTLMALALFSAVLAHCFSPWLNFKGGRGIATAAGGASALFPVLLFLWIAFWVLMYLFKKDIHLSNIVATVMVILVSIFYSDLLNKYSTPPAESNLLFGTYVSIIMLIVLY